MLSRSSFIIFSWLAFLRRSRVLRQDVPHGSMVAAGDVLVCEIVCVVSVSLFRPRFGLILR